jgi:hypothetical protein
VRSGKASRKGLRRWANSGATRGGQERQGRASGSAAWQPVAALLHGREGTEEEEGEGGRQGLRCKLQKLHGPHCNIKFPTILELN